MSTGATKSGKKDMDEVQQAVRYSSLFIYMLKPNYLLTYVFKENKTEEENLFKHMYNFWAQ